MLMVFVVMLALASKLYPGLLVSTGLWADRTPLSGEGGEVPISARRRRWELVVLALNSD